MLPTKFRFIWESGFREDDFLEINQSETRIACGGHVCWQIRNKCNRNYSAILATLQITLYALGV
jgi:hypothetical protein